EKLLYELYTMNQKIINEHRKDLRPVMNLIKENEIIIKSLVAGQFRKPLIMFTKNSNQEK
ncbi:MAG: hypothetical protein ACJA0H_002336, partial [Francisellaceae bacterium]